MNELQRAKRDFHHKIVAWIVSGEHCTCTWVPTLATERITIYWAIRCGCALTGKDPKYFTIGFKSITLNKQL